MASVGDSSRKAPLLGELWHRIQPLARDSLAAQMRAWPWALLAAAIAGALLAAGFYVLAVTGKPLPVLVQDANSLANQPNYYGALEHAEILVLDGAGWITLFAALFCRGRTARFLFLGGLLSVLLACDDLYMLHESVWRVGLNEKIMFAIYAVLLILLVGGHLQRFLTSSFVLLGIALALFAGAIVIDALPKTPFGWVPGIEDLFEMVGICFWSVYFLKCSHDGLKERLAATV